MIGARATQEQFVYKVRHWHSCAMPKPACSNPVQPASKPEQVDHVVSFRLPKALVTAVEGWLQSSGRAGKLSANQYLRAELLRALGPRSRSAVFVDSFVRSVPVWDVVEGDALDTLSRMKSASVDTCVTSPPYFKQKDYKHPRQLGQEKTPEEFVDKLRAVFREVKRVLKPTGTLWLSIDDTYKDKQLLGIPWRLALAMQEDGWILRSEIIWDKRGTCPEPVKDRPTRNHEPVYLFTKSKKYFFAMDDVREPHTNPWAVDCIKKAQETGAVRPENYNAFDREQRIAKGQKGITRAQYGAMMNPLGKPPRSVWTITTQKRKEAHFATFPDELARKCLAAGCPKGGLVLDPFCGTGTTGVAAIGLGQRFLGVELVNASVALARRFLQRAQGALVK